MQIGDREIVHSCTLIVPEREQALISFAVGGWSINVEVAFEQGEDKEAEGSMDVYPVDNNRLRMTFKNWNNPLGTATSQPIRIGNTNRKRELSFLATHWRIGTINRMDILFLLGAES